MMAMRATARRALACEQEGDELEAQLAALVCQVAPTLLEELAVGPVVAAKVPRLLVPIPVGSARRRPSPGSQVVAPIEASSGTVTSHRLSRSGDRRSTGHCTPS